MEIRMIKLIASDLDGTLLQNGAQELTPRAIDLVRKLTEKGIYFVAASGRQYANEPVRPGPGRHLIYRGERICLYPQGESHLPRDHRR